MNKVLLSAAAAAAMLALPTAAHADGGYVDVYGGNDELTLGGPSIDSDMWGADGVIGLSNAQLGAHYGNFDESGEDVWTVDGHLFTRNDSWQLGAGVGYPDLGGDSEWSVAGEGLMFLDRVTLGANVSYSSADLDIVTDDVTSWGVDGEARFFLTDNFRVGVNAGWGNLDAGGGSDDDFTTLGADAEWQFTSAPISIFAGYNHSDAGDFEADAWGVGARWNFGGQSLIERDRHGPNLRTSRGGFSRLFGY
jgi:hypothetical protein